jgi:hypothetical protein
MANEDHLRLIKQGVDAWNKWRDEHPDIQPDLSEAKLDEADLRKANLIRANLSRANLVTAYLNGADLFRANLRGARLNAAILDQADLSEASLPEASLFGATLRFTKLSKANLIGADLSEADLTRANFSRADLRGATLWSTKLLETDFTGANLTDCWIYGASAWGLKLEGATQLNLIITPPTPDEPTITVDNLEIAQFMYLLLNNPKIRDVIDTIGRKSVLLLGRFTNGRITILERLREELRKRGFVPMVFNFDKPDTKDFTETVRLLAGLSHFVIVDITNPRSTPLELQATVPECMVPFVPILEKGEEPFAMLSDLWIKHREWVLDPIRYPSLDRLVEVLDAEIVSPAEVRFNELLKRKAEKLRIKDI